MKEPHSFRLQLKKSHIKWKLKALGKYSEWFPPANLVFELKGDGRTYETYVDGSNRLRLNDIMKYHPELRAGDILEFTPIPESREWRIEIRHLAETAQSRLVDEIVATPRSKPVQFNHSRLQKMVYELAENFQMYADEEFSHEHHRYDVVWRRVKTGNPVKVFEIQVSGSLDSALTKLKHARDLWNADVFLVVVSSADADKAKYLLSGSFHEIAPKTLILRGQDVYEMLSYKDRFGIVEERMRR